MIALSEIKKILHREHYKSNLQTFELGGRTIEQLHVEIIFSNKPEIADLNMIIMYLPDVEKELNGSSILQFFMGVTLENKDLYSTLETLNGLNKRLPLGYFGYDTENETLFIKNNLLVNDQKNDTSTEKNLINILNSMSFLLSSNLNLFF